MTNNRTVCVIAASVALVLIGGCTAGSSGPAETVAPTESAAPATDPPTTTPVTDPPTTTPAPTTTLAPAAFLRSDGLGAFNFGAAYAAMLAGMSLAVLSDDSLSFPVDRGGGAFDTLDGSFTFAYPSARTVCWDDGVGGHLCAFFGGADATTLSFVGWEYGSTAGVGPLFSASGATANILVSDVPAMPRIDGECFGYTNVFLDGIRLDLQAPPNEVFGTYADDGTYTLLVPPPAGARVSLLMTGQQPQSLGEGADC